MYLKASLAKYAKSKRVDKMNIIYFFVPLLNLLLLVSSLVLSITRRNIIFVMIFLLALMPSLESVGFYLIDRIWSYSVIDTTNTEYRYILQYWIAAVEHCIYFAILVLTLRSFGNQADEKGKLQVKE